LKLTPAPACPIAEAGGRPAANAARQTSAKISVNVETVFSFTPRTGFGSSVGFGGAGTNASLGCAP